MQETFISLTAIMSAALVSVIIANIIPRKLVAEVVLLIAFGAAIGPYGLQFAVETPGVSIIAELGLGLLFLIAGYEVERHEIMGKSGKVAVITWLAGFAIAIVLNIGSMALLDNVTVNSVVVGAIAMTATAIGTLLPILKERKVTDSVMGAYTLSHGAYGEIFPIVAMALLLSSRSIWSTIIVLVIFLGITIGIGFFHTLLQKWNAAVLRLFRIHADSQGQIAVRVVMMLLVSLLTLAAVFELDIILGAFAAGILLRHALPDGSVLVEARLRGIGYGFFIPIFFVVSGMHINIFAVLEQPYTLIWLLVGIILSRGIPVYLASSRVLKDDETPAFNVLKKLQISCYSATSLPIIVAVAEVAQTQEIITPSVASIWVTAGAISVLVFPMMASIFQQMDPVPFEEGDKRVV